MIKEVLIYNFKSIKRAYLKTRKVNLLIGYPNVGKSNILEALSLLSSYQSCQKLMEGYIRYDDLENLFYENDPSSGLVVATNIAASFLRPGSPLSSKFEYSLLLNKNIHLDFLRKSALDESLKSGFLSRINS